MYRMTRQPVALSYLAAAVLCWTGPFCPAADEKTGEKQETAARTPDVIFVPTPQDIVDRMLKEAKVTKSDLVYDLGCGDGRIVVTAAKKYGCRGVGFDIDPKRIAESRKNVTQNKAESLVSIQQKDIFKLDLSKANVITLYLLPELNVRLIPQLKKLKPGSRIVSHDFNMRGVKPDKTIRMRSKEDDTVHKIYLWTTPLNHGQKKTTEDSYAIVRVEETLRVLKGSELIALRKKTLKQYRSELKAWTKAKKQAEGDFTEPRPKRTAIKVVAANCRTEEDARKKLEQLKAASRSKKSRTKTSARS